MPKMQECLISIDLANALRAVVDAMHLHVPNGDAGFKCPECHQPVKAFDAGSTTSAHFEHLERNPACTLSDVSKI